MSLPKYFRERLYRNLFEKTWPLWVGAILSAFLNILMFMYLMPLGGIYPAIADWGVWTYKLDGLNITPPWGTLTSPRLSIISLLNFGSMFGRFCHWQFLYDGRASFGSLAWWKANDMAGI